MRTKTPPTNIYFSIKRHALGAKGGGGQKIYTGINFVVS